MQYSAILPALTAPTASASTVAQQGFIPWTVYPPQKYWACLEAVCHKDNFKA